MSAYPPTSAAKALGYIAVFGTLGYGAYTAFVTKAEVNIHPPPQRPAVIHTKTYYRQHVAERSARLAWCNDNPGIARQDPDCQAAVSASIGWGE